MTGLILFSKMVNGTVPDLPHRPMNTYFRRYAYPKQLFDLKPDKSLQIIIVIPCNNEPDLIISLDSLNNCSPIDGVEVIIA